MRSYMHNFIMENLINVSSHYFDFFATATHTTKELSLEGNSSTSYNSSCELHSTGMEWVLCNLKHSLLYSVLLTLAYVTILVVGLLGNGTVILVLIWKPVMRTVTNLFIFNLAVADFFVLVFCLPATLVANLYQPWILGSFMCRGVTYVQGVSVVASVFSLVAISADRWKAICHQSVSTGGLSHTQAQLCILFIWLLALLLPLPWTQVFEIQVSSTTGLSHCVETWSNETLGLFYFLFVNFFCCYLFPLFLIVAANMIIWWKVSTRGNNNSNEPSLPPASIYVVAVHQKTRRGVGKMLGIVTLAFMLSWMPLYAIAIRVRLAEKVGESEMNVWKKLVPIAQWLGYWNSCINPVLYAFHSVRFRKMCKRLLPKCLQKVSGCTEGAAARGKMEVCRGKRRESGCCRRKQQNGGGELMVSSSHVVYKARITNRTQAGRWASEREILIESHKTRVTRVPSSSGPQTSRTTAV